MSSHRGFLLGMLAALFAGVLVPAATGQGPDASKGERYALLVGVKKYDRSSELRPLQYPERDMVELREVLLAGGYRPENVVLMTQAAGAEETRFLPIAANVRKEIEVLLRDRNEADSVVVAFAGHGVQYQGDDQSYFCPADARLDEKETLISLRDVYRALEGCPARCKLLLSDACRNDPIEAVSRRAALKLASVSRPQVRPPGDVAALFSCSAGELAYESPTLKHGVFFHFVIAALRGEADTNQDRQVNFDELLAFSRQRVQDFVRAEFDGKRQMPFSDSKIGGGFPLVSVKAPVGAPGPRPGAPGPPARTEAEAAALAPRIRIVKPRGGTRLASEKVLVQVEATPEDDEPVTRVQMFLNGKPAQGLPDRSGPTKEGGRTESQWLNLRPGLNVIGAEASNRARSSPRTEVAVVYNPQEALRARPSPKSRPEPGSEPAYLGLFRDRRFTFMEKGVILGAPDYDSPAAKAGIKSQDMLMRFNREPINTWADYKRALARCRPGQTVKVEVGRVKQPLTFEVTLAAGKERD